MASYIDNEKIIALHKDAEQNRVFVETLMGINIYVADELCNYIVGGMDIATAVTDYDPDQKKVIIYVNSKLVNGSKELYDAICLHELGHIFSGHLNEAAQDCLLVKDRLELEADAWAVAHGADAQVLCDYLKDVRDLDISLIGEERYNELLETNEAVKMLDENRKVRIAALSK